MPVKFTVLQKSGLQNANLELHFDCYRPHRGRVQILALSLLVPGEGCAVQTVQAWNVLRWEQRGVWS